MSESSGSHVFLSHNRQDADAVKALARRLWDEGRILTFVDEWNLVPGVPWQPALEQAIADSRAVLVFFGPSGLGPWHHAEMRLALDRAIRSRNAFRVIPVLLPGASPDSLTGLMGQYVWADFRSGLDSTVAFDRLKSGIEGKALSGDTFTLPEELNPYRGLLPFDEAHADFFFGREPDIQRLVEKLARQTFLAVVGPSGSGKSSLVLAGVLPRLRRPEGVLGPGVRIRTMKPGDAPLRALADQLATLVPAEHRLQQAEALHERLRHHPDAFRSALATLTADRPAPFVLVVDQLEELFTHASENGKAEEVAPFLAALDDAVHHAREAIRVIVTLRADFFERALREPVLARLMEDRQVLLGPIQEEALRDILVLPARKVGAYLETSLLTALLKDISSEPGQLPLLQDVLDQLWRARSGAWLTLEAYQALGGLQKALERRAQSAYEALSSEEQTVARHIFVRLVALGEGREDTRRRVPRGELVFEEVSAATVDRALQALSGPRARLLVLNQAQGSVTRQTTIEVAHEVLIRTWPTLRRWVDEDRRPLRVRGRLTDAATEWTEKGQDASYLYRGARLADAEELLTQRPELFNQLERGFLEASIRLRHQERSAEEEERRVREAQRERELETAKQLAEAAEASRRGEELNTARAKRSTQQLRLLLMGLLVAFVAVVWVSVLLFQNNQLSFSRELALNARLNIGKDPQRVLLLLQEAQRRGAVDHLGELLDDWARDPCRVVLRGHRGLVFQAAFSPDGTRVVTASTDGTVRAWDASSGMPLATLLDRSDAVTTVAFSPDGTRFVTASYDLTAQVWAASSDTPQATLSKHSDAVTAAAFSPDGARVVTASDDRTARVWDFSSGKSLVTLSGHSAAVTAVAFSPDGSRVVTASDDHNAQVWDASSGKPLVTLSGHFASVTAVAFSRDGARVVTASYDRTARIWDASSGKALVTLSGHSAAVTAVAFSPDGARVVTASADRTARVWDVSSGKSLATLSGHSDTVKAVAFSPDGDRIVTASYDRTARVWDAPSGKPLAKPSEHFDAMTAAAFSPDGARVVTASYDRTVWVRDASSGESLATLSGHSDAVTATAFSPDGARVATASADRTARVWDASSGKSLVTLSGHVATVKAVAFSPDGARVVTASADRTAQVWDASSGKSLVTLSGHSATVNAVAFSPDGARVVTASADGTARVWDASSGKPLATLSGHSATVNAVVFSPDGTLVVTASDDRTARVWAAFGSKSLVTLSGHSDTVTAVAFSPDGARVVTASSDRTARVWDISSGKSLATLSGHSDAVTAAAFSPDGARVVTLSWDGTARLWPNWRWDPKAFARLDVGRALTCHERRTYLHEDIACPSEDRAAESTSP